MFLMVEEGIRGAICHAIHRYVKANNKYMKNYNKDMESSYLEYLDANNLYGLTMSQKIPVNGFEWVEEQSQFNKDFIKSYDEDSNKGDILKVDVEYPKNLLNLHGDLRFYLKNVKLKNAISFACSTKKKKNMLTKKRKWQRKICCSHKGLKTSIKW